MTITSKSKVAAMVAGLAIATSMLALAPMASAASLTSAQVASILSMIQAFGADSATIANVNAALTGTAAPAATTGSSVAFTKDLTIGSSGAEVTALQTALIAKGYAIAAGATGYFGAQTKAAVSAWQTAAGVTPAAGYFGAKSRAAFGGVVATPTTTTTTTTTTTPTTTSTPGAEGSFTTVQSATPANNTNVTVNGNVAVYGIQVKATGSDMTIDRQDLQVKVMVSTTQVNPSAFITSVSAYDGSTLLKTMPIAYADVNKDSDNLYYIRMTGLGFVVPKDTTKTLTFKMNTIALNAVDTARVLTVAGYGTQGTRGVDGAGLSSYVDSSWTSTFTFNASNNSVLTASADSSTPKARNIAVDTTNGVTGVTMQTLSLKSTVGESTMTDMRVVVQTNNSGLSVPTALYLYDGSTLLSSAAVATSSGASYANVDFSNLELAIAKDATKVLTVKADFPSTASGIASTSIASDSTYTLFETPDGTSGTVTIASTIVGNDVHLAITDTAQWTLVSASIAPTAGVVSVASSSLTGTIVLKVVADGGTLTKPIVANFDTSRVWFASSTQLTTNGIGAYAAANAVPVTPSITVTPNDATVGDGSYYTVTVTGTIYSSNALVGSSQPLFMAIGNIDSDMATTDIADQDWGIDSFYTPAAQLTKGTL